MTLLLHTSTPAAYLGLVVEGRFLARDEFLFDPRFSEQLAERIRGFLKTHHSKLRTLTKIVIHAGPASANLPVRQAGASAGRPGGFTGLRIGVTTANTLAYALGIPVIGVRGDISGLDELLQRSAGLPPTKENLVVPAYGREPALGPLPFVRTSCRHSSDRSSTFIDT